MKSKIVTILFALPFALGFGVGGYFGLSNLVSHLWGAIEARSWQPVAASVNHAKLARTGTSSSRAEARYTYEVDGRRYEGIRVGLTKGADNIGDWQHQQFTRLDNANQSGMPIQIWVNPNNPTQAVVDRDIRWGLVMLMVPFAVLFPLVSLGACWVIYRTLRAPADTTIPAPKKLADNPREIASDSRVGLRAIWFFAIVWSVISFPIGFVFVSQNAFGSPAALFVLIFPLIGVLLLWSAVRKTLQWQKHGEVTIALTPPEPHLGSTIALRAQFSRLPPDGAYTVTLLCERVDTRGDSTDYKTIWQQERSVRATASRLETSFLPRGGVPASEPEGSVYHRWRAVLRFPDNRDERSFDLVIRPARVGVDAPPEAVTVGEMSFDVIDDDSIARPIPANVATVRESMNGLNVVYSTANTRSTAWVLLVFGAVFFAVPIFVLFGIGADGAIMPKLMAAVFGAVGAIIVGAAIYSFTHRRKIDIAGQQVRVLDQWLFGTKDIIFTTGEVKSLTSRVSGATTVGNRRYDHHEISAVLHDGRVIALASDVRDAGIAQSLRRLFAKRLVRTGESNSAFASVREPAAGVVLPLAGRKWLHIGVKVFAALFAAAFLWDFVRPFFR